MKKKNREDHRVEGKIAIEKKIAIDRRGGKIEMEISRRIDDETENRGEERCDRSKVRSTRLEEGRGRERKRRKSFGGEFRVSAAHRASRIPWSGRV